MGTETKAPSPMPTEINGSLSTDLDQVLDNLFMVTQRN